MDVSWQSLPAWHNLFLEFTSSLVGTLFCLELCGGMGTAVMCLSLMTPMAFIKSSGFFDIDKTISFLPHLHSIHYEEESLHIGPVLGNILNIPLHDFHDSHCVIAGPPCSPFSRRGLRKGFDDPRAAVFVKTMDIIIHLSLREPSKLMFFILETSDEVMLSSSNSSCGQTHVNVIIQYLVEGLPRWWRVSSSILVTQDFGSPQKRSRAYILGIDRRYFKPGILRQPFPRSIDACVPLSSLISPFPPAGTTYTTPEWRINLQQWKSRLRQYIENKSFKGRVGIFDVCRHGDARYGASFTIDAVPTITASTQQLYMISLGEGHNNGHSIDRLLSLDELALCQGFCPGAIPLCISNTCKKRLIGNSMSPAVLSALLGNVMSCLNISRVDMDACSSPSSSRIYPLDILTYRHKKT